MNKDFTRRMTHEALIILGVLAFFTFMFRLWPLLVLVIFCIIGGAVRLLFLKAKDATVREAEEVKPEVPKPEPTEKDVHNLAYSVILTRITEMVSSEYPTAKWVWEKPNARKLIEDGEEVFILLSGAGGYRRAKVKIQNLQVTGLEYVTATLPEKPKDETDTDADDEEEISEPIPVNYGLIAFEWVEAHVMDLNDRINDAIAQGKDEYLIPEEELPVRDSWSAIIEELGRQDIENLVEDPHGIKINFKQ
ncbi:MAG: hypothetical protein IJD70_07340 [Clostridia bacterium]|nr:hypothetical protein [Clostridia bacterium]